MAKKKDPYLTTLTKLQNMQNSSAKTIQQMVNASNKEQMKFNRKEAATARNWETEMSNTAHQREVQDLKAAGLNPVLSVNQGANSYTTSAASTSNDSGASAMSGLLSQALGAVTNFESSRMQTEATIAAANRSAAAMEYSAQQSAAASRYAAQQNSAAQRYAADRSYDAYRYNSNLNYQASKYNTDVNYKSQKEERANKRWIAQNQTASSWAGILDKNLRNFGVYGEAKKAMKYGFNSIGNQLAGSSQRIKSHFTNKSGKITANNYQLSKSGYNQVKWNLGQHGFKVTKTSINLFVQASVFHDPGALRKLMKNYYIGAASGSSLTKPEQKD